MFTYHGAVQHIDVVAVIVSKDLDVVDLVGWVLAVGVSDVFLNFKMLLMAGMTFQQR